MAARIRSIKPEIRTSEKVSSWPIPLRYFWVLLWGYADDHGRGRDNPRLIRADSFPLDDAISLDQIEEWMAALASAGVVDRYEVGGGRYFSIRNWREHQKPSHPSRSVIPCIHGIVVQGGCDSHEALPKDSGEPREGLRTVSGEPPSRAGRWSGERGAGDAAEAAPPRNCPRHPDGTDAPCGACREARLKHESWVKANTVSAPSVLLPPRSNEIPDCTGPHKWATDGTCINCLARREEKAS